MQRKAISTALLNICVGQRRATIRTWRGYMAIRSLLPYGRIRAWRRSSSAKRTCLRLSAAMVPLVMRGAWEKNQSVAHTLRYDLTLLEDWSALRARSTSVTVPTLVIGGEKSPA